MLKIAVPYTMSTDNKLMMNVLSWPDRCTCCGCEHPQQSVTLSHTARATSSTSTYGNVTTTSRSGYPLNWQVPTCEACQRHQKMARNPVSGGLLVLLGLAIMAGVGYALYSVGYATTPVLAEKDYPVVGGYVVFIGLMFLGGWQFYRMVGAARLKQATQAMMAECTNAPESVWVISDLATVTFMFSNEAYARDFASVNQL